MQEVGTYCCLIIEAARIYCKAFNAASGSNFLVVNSFDINLAFLGKILQDFYTSKLVTEYIP